MNNNNETNKDNNKNNINMLDKYLNDSDNEYVMLYKRMRNALDSQENKKVLVEQNVNKKKKI